MLGIDSPELLIIAIVALIVIGPKELPGMLRSWGNWMSRMRGMASEFRGHVDDMVRQSEIQEVKKQLEASPGLDLQSLDPTREIKNALQEGMAEGEKAMADAKGALTAPFDATPATVAAAPTTADATQASEPAPQIAAQEPLPPPAAAAIPGAEVQPAPRVAAG